MFEPGLDERTLTAASFHAVFDGPRVWPPEVDRQATVTVSPQVSR